MLQRITAQVDDAVTLQVDRAGSSIEIEVKNDRLPAYSRYDGFFCTMEWHYPAGQEMPTTEIVLAGRHMSYVSAGRCERCVLSTSST